VISPTRTVPPRARDAQARQQDFCRRGRTEPSTSPSRQSQEPAHPGGSELALTGGRRRPAGSPVISYAVMEGTIIGQYRIVREICLGRGLEGCTLAITPTPQRIVYSRNGSPDTTATATDSTDTCSSTAWRPALRRSWRRVRPGRCAPRRSRSRWIPPISSDSSRDAPLHPAMVAMRCSVDLDLDVFHISIDTQPDGNAPMIGCAP
jgi:hypothetical protein